MAEIRAISSNNSTIEERLEDLERRGILISSGERSKPLAAVAKQPGAVARFLAERNG